LTLKGRKEMRTGFWLGNATERKKERRKKEREYLVDQGLDEG
jgi:hypothetical protein